jgi:cyanophycinase
MDVIGQGGITVIDPTDVGHSNVADADPSGPISITNLRVHVFGARRARYDLAFRRASLNSPVAATGAIGQGKWRRD